MAFLSDLFSGKSGVKAANQAAEYSRGQINSGYGNAREQLSTGYGNADNMLSGYESAYGGQQGARLYSDSLGVNGAEGGQRAQAAYAAGRNPYLDYEQGRAVDLLNRKNNAGGMRWSGANALAGARAAMGLGYQDNQAWQNRLQGNAAMSGQYGQMRAQNAISQGGAMADSYTGQSNALSNIENQRIMAGQQARSQGMNNLLGGLGFLGSAAMSGFAPGAGGKTAFGNMASAFSGAGSQRNVNALYPNWPTS